MGIIWGLYKDYMGLYGDYIRTIWMFAANPCQICMFGLGYASGYVSV